MSRRETQQAGDLVLVGEILPYAFLDHLAEFTPECAEFVRFIGGHIFQQAEHLLGATFADSLDVFRFLKDFARHVQWQVVGIDDAAHKAQVGRQQLFRIVHDEHAFHIELDAVLGFVIPQIERCTGRHVEQLGVLLAAFHAGMRPGQRIIVVVSDMLVERLVFIVGNFVFGTRP